MGMCIKNLHDSLIISQTTCGIIRLIPEEEAAIMMNMQKMMQQAKKLQKDMEKKQEELANTSFTGTSAQNLVKVTVTGNHTITGLDIDPSLVDPEDIETLQEMTMQALNAAMSEVDTATQKTLGALNPLGGKLPF